ncbi:hypothetical protein D1610_01110 [Sphingomonas gilva]|uniref:Uncharacterized protein n=1 Tax=Sphingomonas gilva TaxID=2305907 RepID=A0A396RQM1_9SPHN|nr:hypothetical protein [Sphingomonas gilva]RHW18788.1 hypothetical protein D1610_01110 [Sphingomonas gilva]
MRALLVLVAIAIIVLIAAVSLGFISLDQTQTAQLPSIEVEGGQAPEFKADVADIDVGTENKTIEVPTISVDKPENAQ